VNLQKLYVDRNTVVPPLRPEVVVERL